MIDLHNHSSFSFDSNTPIEENIKAAIEKELKYIAVTDHMDLIKVTDDYREHTDIEGYFKEVNLLKDKYKNKITVLSGIEVGIQPETAKQNDEITSRYNFDFIIGSVHSLKEEDIYYADLYNRYSSKDLFELYYSEMYEAVKKTDNFDVLGHMDYIDRYAPNPSRVPEIEDNKEVIIEILSYLKSKDKGIEINTAGVRQGLSYMHPRIEVLEWYKDIGGEIITVGSDAHRKEDIGAGVSEACDMLKSLGYDGIYVFENRIPKKIYFK